MKADAITLFTVKCSVMAALYYVMGCFISFNIYFIIEKNSGLQVHEDKRRKPGRLRRCTLNPAALISAASSSVCSQSTSPPPTQPRAGAAQRKARRVHLQGK